MTKEVTTPLKKFKTNTRKSELYRKINNTSATMITKEVQKNLIEKGKALLQNQSKP
jgi:hypothetical protein